MSHDAPSCFVPARICEKSGNSSSELSSTISGSGFTRTATFGFGGVGFLSCLAGFLSRARRERSLSLRANIRNSSGEGSKALERKMEFGRMSFIFLQTGPAQSDTLRVSNNRRQKEVKKPTGTETSCLGILKRLFRNHVLLFVPIAEYSIMDNGGVTHIFQAVCHARAKIESLARYDRITRSELTSADFVSAL
jgi:hypothetical protein